MHVTILYDQNNGLAKNNKVCLHQHPPRLSVCWFASPCTALAAAVLGWCAPQLLAPAPLLPQSTIRLEYSTGTTHVAARSTHADAFSLVILFQSAANAI